MVASVAECMEIACEVGWLRVRACCVCCCVLLCVVCVVFRYVYEMVLM